MEKSANCGFIRKNPIHISIPNMDIYLASNFFGSLTDRPRRLHSHPSYELVWINEKNADSFIITPPLVEHISADASPESVFSFLFTLTNEKADDITHFIGNISTPTEIKDSFGGAVHLEEAKYAAQNMTNGARELIEAELRLFFIKLSRTLYLSKKEYRTPKQTLDEERPAILEEFFNIEMKNPNCSKRLLASKLGVCERQLTRILKEVYNSSFSSILLTSRMNMVDAMLKDETKTTAEIAEAAGYLSEASMKKAYFKFFGEKFRHTK